MSRWYLYRDDEVVGPYDVAELQDHISGNSLVCRAGEKEWRKAKDVDDLKTVLDKDPEQPSPEVTRSSDPGIESSPDSIAGPAEATEETIEPTLETLLEICQKADADELLREHKDHWNEYDELERKLIRREIEARGLSDRL